MELEGSSGISAHGRENSEDINLYINSEIEACIKERRFLAGDISRELRNLVVEILCRKAGGMFLWVKYQINKICREVTAEGVMRVLQELPHNLHETYSRIMKEIDSKMSKRTRHMARRIFGWMLYALRPLSIAELTEAISVVPPEPSFNTDFTLSVVLDICGGLVVFDEGLKGFRFAHSSVESFLHVISEFDPRESHKMIAEVCLTSLIHHRTGSSQEAALLAYSTSNWAVHLRSSGSGSDELKNLCTEFLKPCPAYDAWVGRVQKEVKEFEPVDGGMLSPLLVACYYDLYEVFESLLVEGADPHSSNKENLNSFHICAMKKNGICLQLLLEMVAGFYIDSVDISRRTPLSYAAEYGNEKVVQVLLLNNGALATIDSADGHGNTPLSWAARTGYEKVVKLLLDYGAEIKSLNEDGRTPLSRAAGSGHEKMVQILLGYGAYIDNYSVNGDASTPLSYAARSGHAKVVRILLDRKAAIDSMDEDGRTPLSLAAANGHEKVVQMLLESWAAADSADKNGRTPLSHAAEYGSETLVQMLLEKGVAADRADTNGQTPLSWASMSGNERLVQMLVEKGVLVDSMDKRYGRRPLSYAAEAGHGKVVRISLENGAAADSVDKDGRRPLSWAAGGVHWDPKRGGHAEVAQILLEKGATINSVDSTGRTPLAWARQKQMYEVVDLLESQGGAEEVRRPMILGSAVDIWD